MIVTATKGAITPDQMANLFVNYGYRTAKNGTYLSAFRFVADTFNIEYQETYQLDTAVELLRNNNYLIVSVNNGLFTTGGHLMAIVGIDGDMLKIYDPYLYAGKFETATRRGKVTVEGNTVYCSIENFRNYANYNGFYAYKHSENVTVNNTTVTTSTYTRYVSAKTGLNVRNAPNGAIIGGLHYGTAVTVYETSGNWSRVAQGWVSSSYLSTSSISNTTTTSTIGTLYRLKNVSYIYSNLNLTGTKYTYLAQTQIKVLSNASSTVDYIQVVKTGRQGYVNKSNYSTSVASSTIGQYKRLATTTILYSNSNLSGTKYTYLPLTQVKIIKNVSSNVDYVYVVKTGRYGYVNSNIY